MALSESEAQARQTFGALLARLREQRGLSQVELRDALVAAGVSATPAYVGMWETGKRAPNAEHVAALETVLGAPGLGLVLGHDTGGLMRMATELGALRDRLDAIEGATKPRRPPGRSEVIAAIEADPSLNEEQRTLLLALYKAESGESGT